MKARYRTMSKQARTIATRVFAACCHQTCLQTWRLYCTSSKCSRARLCASLQEGLHTGTACEGMQRVATLHRRCTCSPATSWSAALASTASTFRPSPSLLPPAGAIRGCPGSKQGCLAHLQCLEKRPDITRRGTAPPPGTKVVRWWHLQLYIQRVLNRLMCNWCESQQAACSNACKETFANANTFLYAARTRYTQKTRARM